MELKYGCKSTCKIDIKGCCCSKKASWNALKTQDRNDTLSKIIKRLHIVYVKKPNLMITKNGGNDFKQKNKKYWSIFFNSM